MPASKIFGVKFWYFVHFPVMFSVVIISIASFLVILASINWTWVPQIHTTSNVHSIFGTFSISLSIIQVKNHQILSYKNNWSSLKFHSDNIIRSTPFYPGFILFRKIKFWWIILGMKLFRILDEENFRKLFIEFIQEKYLSNLFLVVYYSGI